MTDLEVHDYVDKMNAELMEKSHHNYQTAVEALMIALVANLRTISMNDPQPDQYDLTDQIVTLEKTLQALRDVISRAHNIVPTT